jgi:hypothetical protein
MISGRWSDAIRARGEKGALTAVTRSSGLVKQWSIRMAGKLEGKVLIEGFSPRLRCIRSPDAAVDVGLVDRARAHRLRRRHLWRARCHEQRCTHNSRLDHHDPYSRPIIHRTIETYRYRSIS